MKIKSLSDLNDSPLLLMCAKDNLLHLTKDWAQLLTNFPIFCDLWSDVIEAKGPPLNFIQRMDIGGELAFAHPAIASGFDRYIVLFSSKYCLKSSITRQGIIMHELGHYYVYRKRFLEQLRVSRESSAFFSQFVTPIVNFREGWSTSQKQGIKNFFDSYILDILKVPGEIFANLWLKENFKEVCVEVFRCQLEEYRRVLCGKEKIQKTLVKFAAFSLVLRLKGLSVLAQDVTELLEEKKVLEVFELSLWKTLRDSARQNEIELFLSFEKSMIEASCSFETANSTLPEIFNDFLIKIPP